MHHQDVLRAIRDQKRVEIIYIDEDCQITQRVISNIKLKDQYLMAYCYSRRSVRLFKVDNILAVQRPKRQVGA